MSGTGRKRSIKKERCIAEDQTLHLIANETEAILAEKRAAWAEAHEIRMKELERQQKEEENIEYQEKEFRTPPVLMAGTFTSPAGRGSGDAASTIVVESPIQDIKEVFAKTAEKYHKAMVSNAHLDNEKNNLMYQVDTLKDSLLELEEQLSESRRENMEKIKECNEEKHACTMLQSQLNEMKEILKQRETLLNGSERQKKCIDVIQMERDELREEVVKLKDILKKHGIIGGLDLTVSGSVDEAGVDGELSADPTFNTAQDVYVPPTEGKSLLGKKKRKKKNKEKKKKGTCDKNQQKSEMVKESRQMKEDVQSPVEDSTLNEQDDTQTIETQKGEKHVSLRCPDPEVNLLTLDQQNASRPDNSRTANIIHTKNAKEELMSTDEIQSEYTTNSPEINQETCSEENTKVEPCALETASQPESTKVFERKDDLPASLEF